MTKPHILLIGLNYPPEETGIAPYTAGMAHGLSLDADVQVVTTHPHYPEWQIAAGYGQWRQDEKLQHLHITRLRHYVPSNPTGMSRIISEATFALRVLMARLTKADVIIVVSPGLLPVITGKMLSKLWRVPLGVVVQDIYSRAVTELGLFGGA